jgi:hypothetical protein
MEDRAAARSPPYERDRLVLSLANRRFSLSKEAKIYFDPWILVASDNNTRLVGV